jgi:hypothetical protein
MTATTMLGSPLLVHEPIRAQVTVTSAEPAIQVLERLERGGLALGVQIRLLG